MPADGRRGVRRGHPQTVGKHTQPGPGPFVPGLDFPPEEVVAPQEGDACVAPTGRLVSVRLAARASGAPAYAQHERPTGTNCEEARADLVSRNQRRNHLMRESRDSLVDGCLLWQLGSNPDDVLRQRVDAVVRVRLKSPYVGCRSIGCHRV
jgi:hypothetical protein